MGCTKGGKLRIEYESEHNTASIQCEDSPTMIQESPAEIYINTYSTTQNIRCTLRCGKYQHEKTVVGHFKYVRPINRGTWTDTGSEIVSQSRRNILGSLMNFIANH